MSKRLAAVFAFAAAAVLVTGCNTIEGAGKDIKAAGAAVEKAASKTKSQ
jgi:predicted small secreted protein